MRGDFSDPAVLRAGAEQADGVINLAFSNDFANLEQGIADDAVSALAAQGLPPLLVTRLGALTPTLTSAVTGFVHDKIAELVASPEFASAWNAAIRTAHQQAVTVLSGDSKAVVVRGDKVYLDLAPLIDLAKKRLSDRGLTAVNAIPDVHPTVALAKADTLVRAQSAYTALDRVARVLETPQRGSVA